MGVHPTILRPLAIIRVVLHDYLRLPLPLAHTRVKTGVGVCACYLTEWNQRLVVAYRPFDTDLYWLQVCTGVSLYLRAKSES